MECAQTGFREVVTTDQVSESCVLSDKKICGKLQICPFIVAVQDKGGYPYVFHPFYLATQMDDEESTCAALLHDVVEDHGARYSFAYLEQAGFPESVIHALRLLTHTACVPYMDYVKELAKDPISRKVKLADLKHNLDARRLNAERPRKYDLYLQAIRYLEEIAQKPDVK